MNKTLAPVLAGCWLAGAGALAQSAAEPPIQLTQRPAPHGLNEFRVSARMGYNISAQLVNTGWSPAQTRPQPPAPLNASQQFVSATGRTYQDGYVGIDRSGNFEDLSSYWGYANASQVLGDNLLLSYSASGTLLRDFKNDPQPGVELSYARQVGERADGSTYGFEAGFAYTSLDLPSTSLANPAILGADAFSFGGRTIPGAGHQGTYEGGPGYALIGATPIANYPVRVQSAFEASLYELKLGPYLQFPVAKRLSFALSGGLSLLLADSQLRIQQTPSVPGAATTSLSGSELAVLPGAYIAGRLCLIASDSVNVFTGLTYESNGHHSQTLADKRLDLDFWNALYWTFGVSYSF